MLLNNPSTQNNNPSSLNNPSSSNDIYNIRARAQAQARKLAQAQGQGPRAHGPGPRAQGPWTRAKGPGPAPIFRPGPGPGPRFGIQSRPRGVFFLHFFCISLPDLGGNIFTFFLYLGMFSLNPMTPCFGMSRSLGMQSC